MKIRLINYWESLKTSFWFLPGIMVFASILLASVIVAIDKNSGLDSHRIFGYFYTGEAEGARSLLSTIAGSMITVAGVAFSITIVALTLASSQFGPRLLRNFMKDTGNQVVIGIFIATFIYCLLVLLSIPTADGSNFLPIFSIAFAVVLALFNIGALIYFIHHISTMMQADHVIATVYSELEDRIGIFFPDNIDTDSDNPEVTEEEVQSELNFYLQNAEVNSSKSGYLQAVDYSRLTELADNKDFLLVLHHRAGDFLSAGHTLATVDYHQGYDDKVGKEIVGCFITGTSRTPEQDVEFMFNQLVEIAVRALSPGINDPFTASTCIDWTGAALTELIGKKFPSPYHFDQKGKLRIIAQTLEFARIIDISFNQIRSYGRKSPLVMFQLLHTIQRLTIHSRTENQRQTLLKHAELIAETGREYLPHEDERKNIQERYQNLLEAVKR